jgi:hypothetical protein
MTHPFQFIPNDKYWLVFLPLLVFTLLLTLVLSAIPLKPNIVQFELNAPQVIKSWREIDKMWAAFSLGLDFLYLVVYSTTSSLACIWVANVLEIRELPLTLVGVLLAWTQWLAALLDAVENTALVKILFGDKINILPKIAKWCALSKFGFIFLALFYVGIGGVILIGSSLFKS